MRKITIPSKTITIYSFDELPEDVQASIIEKNRDMNVFFGSDWYEYTLDWWKEKLEIIGFEDADIRFSGFWSQGDGASFTCKNCDAEKILNTLLVCQEKNTGDLKKWRLWFELAETRLITFQTSRNTYRYVHENTVSISVDEDFCGLNNNMWYAPDPQKPYSFTSIFEKKASLIELGDMLDDYLKSLCQEIYHDLKKEYKYLTSDESIKEAIQGHEYYEDGEIYE